MVGIVISFFSGMLTCVLLLAYLGHREEKKEERGDFPE